MLAEFGMISATFWFRPTFGDFGQLGPNSGRLRPIVANFDRDEPDFEPELGEIQATPADLGMLSATCWPAPTNFWPNFATRLVVCVMVSKVNTRDNLCRRSTTARVRLCTCSSGVPADIAIRRFSTYAVATVSLPRPFFAMIACPCSRSGPRQREQKGTQQPSQHLFAARLARPRHAQDTRFVIQLGGSAMPVRSVEHRIPPQRKGLAEPQAADEAEPAAPRVDGAGAEARRGAAPLGERPRGSGLVVGLAARVGGGAAVRRRGLVSVRSSASGI